jgi:hypothetical protein
MERIREVEVCFHSSGEEAWRWGFKSKREARMVREVRRQSLLVKPVKDNLSLISQFS